MAATLLNAPVQQKLWNLPARLHSHTSVMFLCLTITSGGGWYRYGNLLVDEQDNVKRVQLAQEYLDGSAALAGGRNPSNTPSTKDVEQALASGRDSSNPPSTKEVEQTLDSLKQ